MLTITNDVITISVPAGAFKNYYEHSGFRPLEDSYDASEEVVITTHDLPLGDLSEDSTQLKSAVIEESEICEAYNDLSEIPIGEMDFKQLHAYAEQLGLDHKDVHSKKDLKSLIRDHIK